MFPFNKIQNSRTRRIVMIGSGAIVLAAIAVIAIVVITLLRNDNPNLAQDAPLIPTTAAGAKRAGLPSAYQSGGVIHFVIDSGSSAKYVAREQLALVPLPTNAVAVTKDVTGDLYVTKDGLVSGQRSSFKVDLRTLVSDESLRDRQAKNNLNTDGFPFAEFVADSATNFPKDYAANQQTQLTLKGTLTLHGVSKPVEWAVFARAAGDYLTAVADTDIKMTDFGVNPPTVSVSRVEDKLHIQVILYAKLSN